MIKLEISPNAQAILLLTAPLIAGGKKEASEQPLSLKEYNCLAQTLRQANLEPADLLHSDLFTNGSVLGEHDQLERVQRLLRRGFLLAQAIEQWRSRAIWVITRADLSYPTRLKRRLGDIAPPVLYGCGDLRLLDGDGLAVVGSRNADADVALYAEKLGQLSTKAQCTIVSGGARGIDQSAMESALCSGGSAVGVLANGLESAVLSRENRDRIIDERLLLISPFDPKAGFNVGNAMARNKLVYALADVGVILAAEHMRGGTWAGAIEQLERFRFGPLYVRCSHRGGDGLDALINRGALEWPEPQNSDELRSIFVGKVARVPESKSQQIPLFNGEIDKESPHKMEMKVNVEHQPTSPEVQSSPADDLLEKVRCLLAPISYPLTDASAADILGVNKRQASNWLRQLEQSGAYAKLKKPNRYVKVEHGIKYP